MAKLLNKKDVAEMLNCSVRQIDYLRQKNGLPFVRLGVNIKFRPESVEEWILKQEQAKETETEQPENA